MKIAVVQKCPSNVDYAKQFQLDKLDVFNLSSQKVTKLLKKDVDLVIQTKSGYDNILAHIEEGNSSYSEGDLGFCPEAYDWVILVGSEALKMFTKATAVTDYTGKVAPGKNGETNFIAAISPAMLAFKPEAKPVFDETVINIHRVLNGKDVETFEGDYQFYNTTEDILQHLNWLIAHPEYKVLALDSETSALAPRKGYILGVSLSHEINQGVYMDADYFDQACINALQKLINTRRIVLHNAKFDMHFFTYHFGLLFVGRDIHDTMIMHYLLDERQGTHGLKSLTMKYGTLGDYDRELDEFKKEYCRTYKVKAEDFSYDLIPWDIIKMYAAKDTDATLFLYHKFFPILQNNPRLYKCYTELMLPALHLLTKMEARGIPVSAARLEGARELLEDEISRLKKELYSYAEVTRLEEVQGAIFNPNSTKQLRVLLFDVLNLNPTGKLTATGAISTDSEVLKELSLVHKIPELILGIRQATKLKNTYIDKLLPIIDTDSRVRTGFNLTSTTSGRLSSSGNFNMQQLPRDNPIIKGCVVAPAGYKIVACDLVTAEIYFAAVLSQDSAMKQVFINMKENPEEYPDFHSNIAHMVFNLSCKPSEVKKLYPALRQAAKAISFGILYGSGPSKVAEAVNEALLENNLPANCDKEQALEYIETYFNRFPRLKAWIDSCHTEIKRNGFIYNHFGRKRRLHNIDSCDRGLASSEMRSGFNAIIQSVSSDHLLIGAAEADEEILSIGLDAQIFALVHDSIVAVVREDQVDQYLEIVIRNIQKDRGCSIPNCPVGVSQDSEDGGSRDYSCGKLEQYYPDLALVCV